MRWDDLGLDVGNLYVVWQLLKPGPAGVKRITFHGLRHTCAALEIFSRALLHGSVR